MMAYHFLRGGRYVWIGLGFFELVVIGVVLLTVAAIAGAVVFVVSRGGRGDDDR
jgi:hypothetical protein